MTIAIVEEAKALQAQLVAWRRDIHQHPELGFHEERTAALAADELERLGYRVRRGVGKTGVLGDLDAPGSRGRLLLRADMDALPIQEDSGEPFTSLTPGAMHACGHDSHVAMLLGAARILASHRGELAAPVRLMFQPCEESSPSGAPAMIAAGCLEGVEAAFAIHVLTDWPAGVWAIRPGAIMAAVDKVLVSVIGRGGHAAAPEHCADPVVAAAEAVLALQTVMSRRVPAIEAGVLSLCAIHGGGAYNVIPERVDLVGTMRTHSQAVREKAQAAARQICQGVAQAHGVRIEITFEASYPPTINDPAFTEKVRAAARELFGPAALVECPKKFGGEDFACLLERAAGAMAFLGAANPAKGASFPHHSPHFRIDEDVLWQGTALLAHMAMAHGTPAIPMGCR